MTLQSDGPGPPPLRLSKDELAPFLDAAFPPGVRARLGELVSVAPGHARLALQPDASMVRAGNIVSGPTMMGLIDLAAYAVILAHIGPVEMAVTNTLSVTFLRGCRLDRIFADARPLKLGRRLATVDVRLWQASEDGLIAQATVGYALPADHR
jgi:uncharacterized protein (TIGR00369 family)